MGWVKEANKLGEYKQSRYGYRIYITCQPSFTESHVLRNGELYHKSEFTKGEYIAINKQGEQLSGDLWIIIAKIDNQHFFGIQPNDRGE